jgi:hypothetical protein
MVYLLEMVDLSMAMLNYQRVYVERIGKQKHRKAVALCNYLGI